MIRPIKHYTADDVREQSFALNMGIDEDQLEEYARLLNVMIDAVKPVDQNQGRTSSLSQASGNVTRTIEDVNEEERAARDPLNAIVRWVSVKSNERRAKNGALAGMRMGMKDNIAVAGIPLTCASRIMQGFVPTIDSVVTQRLIEAGAEIVAITNMENMAFSGGGESSHYGPIGNPCDPTRVSGGSSGGSGASLAYPWIDATIGGDQGGSIRIPAAWCGVVGHKPTHSLVPYTGALGIDKTIDHLGPMTRNVEDAAKILRVISGPDPSDPRQLALNARKTHADLDALLKGEADMTLKGLKLGVLREGFGEAAGVEPGIEAAVRKAVDQLAELGAELVDVSVPEHLTAPSPSFAIFAEGMVASLYGTGAGTGTFGQYWPEVAQALGQGMLTGAPDLSPQFKAIVMCGTMLRDNYFGATYAYAMRRRDEIRAAFDRAFDDVNALVMPTLPTLPYEIDPTLPVDEWVLRGWAMITNTTTFNMTGHPAVTLPTSKVDGLPVGTMLVGPQLSDGELFRVAAAYEDKFGWELGADGTMGA